MELQILSNFHNSINPDKSQQEAVLGHRKSHYAVQNQNLNFCANDTLVSKKTRAGVFLTTLAGVATAFTLLAKGKGMKIPEALKKMQYEEKEILSLAGGSVIGGLVGGAIFDDKKHLRAKVRESVVQMLGNISMPLICVGGGIRLFNKFEPKIAKMLPKVASEKGNAIIQAIPKVIATMSTLAVGIVAGNKVSNALNEKVFHVKDNRKVELKDFSAHIDDACMGISLVSMNSDNPLSKGISRVIPAALLIAGNSVGVTKDKHLNETH